MVGALDLSGDTSSAYVHPVTGRHLLDRLLPSRVDRFAGPTWALVVLVVVNVIGTTRALVHVLAPDSGAESVATIDVDVDGGANVVAMLGQWGGGQLVMAVFVWTVIARYRGLVPLALALVLLEQLLRLGVGLAKPLDTVSTAPGSPGTKAALVVVALTLMATLGARASTARFESGHKGPA